MRQVRAKGEPTDRTVRQVVVGVAGVKEAVMAMSMKEVSGVRTTEGLGATLAEVIHKQAIRAVAMEDAVEADSRKTRGILAAGEEQGLTEMRAPARQQLRLQLTQGLEEDRTRSLVAAVRVRIVEGSDAYIIHMSPTGFTSKTRNSTVSFRRSSLALRECSRSIGQSMYVASC
jgi:hypothetical protein